MRGSMRDKQEGRADPGAAVEMPEGEGGGKSLLVAYLLLLVGGIFGLHHLYLGNVRRAKTYLCTLGLCGVGWVLDFCRLPGLVAAANLQQNGGQETELPPVRRHQGRQYENPERAARLERQASRFREHRERERERERERQIRGLENPDQRELRGMDHPGHGRHHGGVGASQSLLFLQSTFSNMEEAVVQRVFKDNKGSVTRCVEILSEMSEAQRRQITVVQSPIPTSCGADANLDESGARECMVCFSNDPLDAMLLPCQHSGMCVACAGLILKRNPPECPVCRIYVSEVLQFVGTPEAKKEKPVKDSSTTPDDKKDTESEVDTAVHAQTHRESHISPEEPASSFTTSQCEEVHLQVHGHHGNHGNAASFGGVGGAGAGAGAGPGPGEAERGEQEQDSKAPQEV